jgi:hypothetical protein
MSLRLFIPLSWRRHPKYCIQTDRIEPLRRFIYLHIARDTRIHFAHWGWAYTFRLGIGYA